MPITLYTGLPGAGKSLGLVEHMLRLRKGKEDRPIYAHGIDGLVAGIAEPLPGLEHWGDLPHGSLIVVDECQEVMPTDRGNTPEWIRALSRHRHLGIDFLIATQHPSLISSYVRRLIGEHYHHVRKFGSGVVDRYRWAKCMDMPETPLARREAIKTLWRFPKECFSYYKSASVHTIKRKIPRKVWWLLGMGVMTVVAVFAVPVVLDRAAAANQRAISGAGGPSPAGSSAGGVVAMAASELMRRDNYGKWLRPRVEGVPWSAPAFDGLKVVAEPSIMCMAGEDGRCECMTEQGTRYAVSLKVCRTIVRDGLYDPFLAPDRDRPGHDADTRDGRTQRASPASPTARRAAVDEGDADGGPPRSEDAEAMRGDYVPPEWVPTPKPYTATGESGD